MLGKAHDLQDDTQCSEFMAMAFFSALVFLLSALVVLLAWVPKSPGIGGSS
jgi:hypothetical protein